MTERFYRITNNSLGWLAFIVAALTYFATLEPTTSLWDCGEFISASYKLQVVHPPGAPFFLMLNRLFTLFADDSDMVAILINGQSALASAFTILFLFWTITALSRRILVRNGNIPTQGQMFAIMGSGLVGALAFTFSDTFWFSAVEGEVYALSSFFMAIVFWLMLKWQERRNEPRNMRWLILIAFLMGISIGVHLLSLLVLPVLAFVYYFNTTSKVTNFGLLISFIVGMLVLALILVGMIQYLPLIASRVELVFVNTFGFPFWSGILYTLALVIALIIFGIIYSINHGKLILNVALTSLAAIFIGYSAYSMVVIRSMANPSIDMNNPETVFNLISYLNREQYGDRPLLFGPYYTANVVDIKEGRMQYRKTEDGYVKAGPKIEQVFDKDHQTLFPRMGDTRRDRVRAYQAWENIPKGEKPTFGDNISFFLTYQVGHMYWRYFAWNFIGRQNDEQGHGSFLNGNWLSGITFLDEIFANVGEQDILPYAQKFSKARNTLYFLPFIFGLLGIFFHFKHRQRDAFAVLMFFLMTGAFLVIYLNNPPREPRERDYTLVGSFYVFAIWIGIGVLPLIKYLAARINAKVAALLVTVIALLAVPAVMAVEEWDDHDRSERYTTRDFAMNYLMSCDKNAILFTNGDNDTYPVWYVQEVLGYRTDVRVVNLQLMMTDWYVDQLRKKVNDSEPFPLSFPQEKIVQGTRDYILFQKSTNLDPKKYYNISQIVEFIMSDDPNTKVRTQGGDMMDFFPTRRMSIPVNKENALASGIVRKEYADQMVDEIRFDIGKNNIMKSDLVIMDLISSLNWKRAIQFTITAGADAYLNLGDYLQQNGLTYKIVPIKVKSENRMEPGSVDYIGMYDNLVNNFKWGDLPVKDLYVGDVTRRHCQNYRNLFRRLSDELIKRGDYEKAVIALDKCIEVLPEHNVPYDLNMIFLLDNYYKARAPEKGQALAIPLRNMFEMDLAYYAALDPSNRKQVQQEIQGTFYGLNRIKELATQAGQEEFASETEEIMNRYQELYM